MEEDTYTIIIPGESKGGGKLYDTGESIVTLIPTTSEPDTIYQVQQGTPETVAENKGWSKQ